jgi:hypothetical protein
MLIVICDQINGITVPDDKAFDFMLSVINTPEPQLELGLIHCLTCLKF